MHQLSLSRSLSLSLSLYIYIYTSVLANATPASIFSQLPQPRVDCFLLFFLFNLWKFWDRMLTYCCCSTHCLIDSKMECFSQPTGCPCLCLNSSFLPFAGLEACSTPCLAPCRGCTVHLCLLSSTGHNLLRVRQDPSLPRTPGASPTPQGPSKHLPHEGVNMRVWKAGWCGFCHDVAVRMLEDGIWDTLSSQEDYSPSWALQLCPVGVRRWASDAGSLRAFCSLPWVAPGHSCPFTAMTYSLLFTKTEVDLPMDFLGSPVLRRHDSPGFVLGALSLLFHVILTISLWYRNWQGLPFTGVRTEAQRVLGTLH